MKNFYFLSLLIFSLGLSAQSISPGTNLFDFDWKFHKGGAQGAENTSFSDSNWRNIDLPHDWSIEEIRRMQPGDLLEIIPVHSCLAADLAGNYLTNEGEVLHKMSK